MSERILIISVLFCAGCAVAPLGFYESAFPSQKHMALRGGIDVARAYDEIPSDSGRGYETPSFLSSVSIVGIDYSPFPYLSLGGELTGPPLFFGAWGAGIRTKAVPLAGDNIAAAVLLRGGVNSAKEEADAWGPAVSYNTQYLVGGGIVSLGSPTISFGVGPKVVLSHVNISGAGEFSGNVMDYGGFFNLVLNYGILGLAAEVSALSIDRPYAGKRSLRPYGGAMLKLMF
ncbi:MAG: hypothetical protein ACPL68_06510 [Candidatus Hydrothermia bacterium]